jgi:hypothetical protein
MKEGCYYFDPKLVWVYKIMEIRLASLITNLIYCNRGLSGKCTWSLNKSIGDIQLRSLDLRLLGVNLGK